jgi:hypothetical protein
VKHIKQFYRFIKESYGENPSINWELINTARDLSLEYLDEGFILHYYIDIISLKHKKVLRPDGYVIEDGILIDPWDVLLEGIFSHDGDQLSYDTDVMKEFKSFNHNLRYFFILNRQLSGGHANNSMFLDCVDKNTILISKLREIYPNEEIKFNYE